MYRQINYPSPHSLFPTIFQLPNGKSPTKRHIRPRKPQVVLRPLARCYEPAQSWKSEMTAKTIHSKPIPSTTLLISQQTAVNRFEFLLVDWFADGDWQFDCLIISLFVGFYHTSSQFTPGDTREAVLNEATNHSLSPQFADLSGLLSAELQTFNEYLLFVSIVYQTKPLLWEANGLLSRRNHHGYPNFRAYKDYLGILMSSCPVQIPTRKTSNPSRNVSFVASLNHPCLRLHFEVVSSFATHADVFCARHCLFHERILTGVFIPFMTIHLSPV